LICNLSGHFGKWHLNGLRGPGVPILKDDNHNPGKFGFDFWFSTTNFFDVNPLMSDNGKFIDFKGSSSKVIFNEALKFIDKNNADNTPFFAVIWDGSPHYPWTANEDDKSVFKDLDIESQNHYGELVAFDRNLGKFRKLIREKGLSENTIIWFCSDNGGLKGIYPSTVGGLRGNKGSVWEGGIRVPAIIEWPSMIKHKVTDFPASTMDIFPTIADIIGLSKSEMIFPIDGISLLPLFNSNVDKREVHIPFRFNNTGALIDNDFKLVATSLNEMQFELYDLEIDPKESNNIATANPHLFEKLKDKYLEWNLSVNNSVNGKDYPENMVLEQPKPHFWMQDARYEPYLKEFSKRPEYENRIKRGY
jgi:arylsulfatase A-like enzyme